MTPIAGRLGDMFGKKRALVTVLVDPRARHRARRARDVDRRDDRRARDPGRGRRSVPARVRDHPRRVPDRARSARHRADLRDHGHRRRPRNRARGADHRAPLVSLALLVPADRGRRGDARDRLLRSRVADQDAGTRRHTRRDAARGLARRAARCRERGLELGLDVGAHDRPARRRGGAARRLGPRRVAYDGCRSSTCT